MLVSHLFLALQSHEATRYNVTRALVDEAFLVSVCFDLVLSLVTVFADLKIRF